MIVKKLSTYLLVAGWAMVAWSSGDESTATDTSAADGPHAVIENMTQELLSGMERFRQTVDRNPEPFFQFLEERLVTIVDFPWIAANVMGPYRKKASEEQRNRFAEVFRRSLIETYGRGLLAYSGETIDVRPPAEGDLEEKRVYVTQEIHGSTQVYPVTYTLAQNRQGQWKILNVMLNGVNLGKTFRNQFVQAARNNGDDIDKVIDSWATEV